MKFLRTFSAWPHVPLLLLTGTPGAALACMAQHAPASVPPATGGFTLIPMTLPSPSAAQLELVKLDAEFEAAVEKGGGPAFAARFADDATLLNNAQPPILGGRAIAAAATWQPAAYRLTWQLAGATSTGPGSGVTWGHYVATADGPAGAPGGGRTSTTREGRYLTVWTRRGDVWQVALEASADDAPGAPLTPLAPLAPAPPAAPLQPLPAIPAVPAGAPAAMPAPAEPQR